MTEGRQVQRLFKGDTAAGHSWPSIGGEYYTPTPRSALWHAFQQHTRGTKPLPVRPNHRTALSRVRDPKPIPSPPGTTRAGIIPLRYSPDLLQVGGQGETRVTCHPGKKIRESNPTRPMRSPRRIALSSSCRVPSWPSLFICERYHRVPNRCFCKNK